MDKHNNLTVFLTSLADKFRSYLFDAPVGDTPSFPINPQDFENTVDSIYIISKQRGKQSAYDEFWDSYQQNGNRTKYYAAFYGEGWNLHTFKPKYPLQPTDASMMFGDFFAGEEAVDFTELEGVQLDMSNCTIGTQMFSSANIRKLGTLDLRSGDKPFRYMFFNCRVIEEIEKIILYQTSATDAYQNAFNNCTALKKITFEGVICQDLDMHWSTLLTADSIVSIVEHLGGTNSVTLTLSQTAINNADWSTTDYADWDALLATKPSNWTISLV